MKREKPLQFRETCACKFCGTATPMTGTRMCDRCWELNRRIGSDPALALKILAAHVGMSVRHPDSPPDSKS